MTVGQRIAQKRKEQGLSQEALGEALGVSRQSVYKWESDSALPEIEKLITMSRLFDVTVGWLLGVENEGVSPETNKGEPDELTETQLKMVEAIVDRYLAAQQPPKKRRWPWVIVAIAAVCLLVVLNNLRSDLQNMQYQYSNLQNSINSVSGTVNSQIYSITSRVEEVLKNQNNLTASYGTEAVSTDIPANTITFTAYAAPKTYTEGMAAAFIIDDGKTTVEFPGKLGENQTFTAELSCELTDEITISAVFITGDVRETQLLDTHYGFLSRSLPDTPYDLTFADGMMWKKLNKDGMLDWSNEYEVCKLSRYTPVDSVYYMDGTRVGQAELKSFRIGLFQNQKLLGWLEPCEMPNKYVNYDEDEYDFYRYPAVSVTPALEDSFTLAIVMVDEYDREFVFADIPYSLERERDELTPASGSTYGIDDPANWEY